MPYDPTSPVRFNPLAGALGQQRMGNMGQKYGSMLTDAGYGGPMPGTPEFQAARAAGGTPIRDWAKENRGALMDQFQQGGGFGNHGGMGMGGPRPMFDGGGIGGPRPSAPAGGGYDSGGINPGGMYTPPSAPTPRPMPMGGQAAGFGLPTAHAPRPMGAPAMPSGNTGVVPPNMRKIPSVLR